MTARQLAEFLYCYEPDDEVELCIPTTTGQFLFPIEYCESIKDNERKTIVLLVAEGSVTFTFTEREGENE